MDITIGANRETLRKTAQTLLDACDKRGTIDVVIYAEYNGRGNEEVTIAISNDDMEDRTDLTNPNVIFVDVDA